MKQLRVRGAHRAGAVRTCAGLHAPRGSLAAVVQDVSPLQRTLWAAEGPGEGCSPGWSEDIGLFLGAWG
jgi:hypothetical protein